MANEQNFAKPFTSSQSREKARENGRKGGIASGVARREKRLFKEEICKRLGVDDFNEIIDNLIKRAKEQDKSFETLRDTMGQKPKEEIEAKINMTYEDYIKEVEDENEY